MEQIRQKKDTMQYQVQKDKIEYQNMTGLKIGEYNPDFRDLLRYELERQIKEKKEFNDQSKYKKLQDEKDKVRKLNDTMKARDEEAQNSQLSTKQKLRDMVKSDYDRAWRQKDAKRKTKLIDKDVVPEFDTAGPGLGILADEEVLMDEPARLKKPHQEHDVNRKSELEDDYWFTKRLMENEKKILNQEVKNEWTKRHALETMLHEDETQIGKKVIIGGKLRTRQY